MEEYQLLRMPSCLISLLFSKLLGYQSVCRLYSVVDSFFTTLGSQVMGSAARNKSAMTYASEVL